MKFEKISNNKIKVTLDSADLSANDIDLHSFMSASDDTQALFLDVLETAEKDYDFSTKDYKIKLETLALPNGNFVLTITRELADTVQQDVPTISRKKVRISRKSQKIEPSSMIYKFNTFDDFCGLCNSFYNNKFMSFKEMFKDSILYNYNDKYFLVLTDINTKSPNLKILFSSFTEFATYVDSSDIFIAKLHETGKLIFKEKAFQNCTKYFLKDTIQK